MRITMNNSDMERYLRIAEHIKDEVKIPYSEFKQLNTEIIVPLDFKIDLKQFHTDIEKYKENFKRWGEKHQEYPRFGIPLVNISGKIDEEIDPSCYPLDQWAEKYPDSVYWDNDFTNHTELMQMPSLNVLAPLKDHMLRSNILLWNKDGHFLPHFDMHPDYITHYRLWGVNTDDTGYSLEYGDTIIRDWEPGRLYLIDTTLIHSAKALIDNVYTFFISVDLAAKEVLEKSKKYREYYNAI